MKKNPRAEQQENLPTDYTRVVPSHMRKPQTSGLLHLHPIPVPLATAKSLSLTKFEPGLLSSFQLGLNFWASAFVCVLPNFSKNPAKSVQPDPPCSKSDHPLYLIRFLILHHLPGDVQSPGPPAAGILSGQFSQNPTSALTFPLGNSLPTDLHLAPWLLDDKFVLFFVCIQN